MKRTIWKEKQLEILEHRCENIYLEENVKQYIKDLIDDAVSSCGSTKISPENMTERNDVLKRMKFLNIKNGYVK